jgi:hypothetical protein
VNAAAATPPANAPLPVWRDPAFKARNVDIVAVLIALSLPWSTSLVGIFCLVWLWAVAATLDFRLFLRSLKRPVSALPIGLFVLALVGTLWSEASWSARFYALGPVSKFLVLPFLLYHFERSARGMWVFVAFLVSCAVLLLVSWLVLMYPGLTLKPGDVDRGIFVKNYIDQSQEFALCAVALAYPAVMLLRDGRVWQALLLIAIAVSFVANMAFVIVSRTALGDHAGHARGVCADALEMADQCHAVFGGDRAGRAGVDGIAATAGDHRKVRARLPDLQGIQTADFNRAAARILAEVAALLCRSTDHRLRNRIDAGVVRGGGHRPGDARPGAGDRKSA